jgi:hypothetical protein
MTEHSTCDRCGKPLQRFPEGWRHVRYAKRGQVCLHPSVSPATRRGHALRERYGALGGWVA